MKPHTRSYWTDRLSQSRKPKFPAHRGPLDLDVAIVGGGLIGCTTAHAFASAGARVALFEAQHVGAQATAASPGIIFAEPSLSLATLQASSGRRAARAIWEMSRGAALDFVSMLRRLGIKCELESVVIASYLNEREDSRELERERDLRREMGIDGDWMTPPRARASLQMATPGAIRAKSGAVFDPYRACLGLARAAVSRGAKVFEKSPVVRIRQSDGGVEIDAGRGTATAARVIVTTGGPTRSFKPLARRFTPLVTYRVITPPLPAVLRRQLPPASVALREATCPGHLLRWTRDRRLLFAGVERARLAERSRPNALVQHAAQLMYELSLLYPHLSGIQPGAVWDAATSVSDDGLPYIGPHRHYPRHLFALGAGRSGGGVALLAARILLRHWQDAPEKGDALFGFGR